MIGTIVNAISIIAGSLLGLLLRKGIPEGYKSTVMQALSLAVMLIGIKSALMTDDLLVVIISLAIGSVIGEYVGIESGLEKLGQWIEGRFSNESGSVSKGFVTASLVYCVGSMAIVGSFESGLTGNHQTLFAKSALDGISAIIFASSMGVGVLLSFIPVFLYQGLLTVTAGLIKPFLVASVISQMSATGGLLILAIGINLLGVVKIRVGNMLPAVFIPFVYYLIQILLSP
ncbi:MAG: DUF554 domain-containing protein [Deltaproteobacteria bacterium]|jgi:uncharacterized protein|nr:DUF554 domain-containing protein [Deltaproteobacteria bacterium]MBT4268859.1 DUF554 domain-containing protein [Deltaproteobacteria bacterium]MBT4641833.1 DUF554 domain-containing protein [Deltaproteobacteria bacterium]MBT6504574.1 DUF554 domain-containing protein [Deltaproteobacteria bacterium]MBT6612188.1 DUF554 domain-containing protein [Deltaproteobacteria bacterium]